MKNFIITLLLLPLFFTGFAQDFSYMVRPTYKKPIKAEVLNTAKTMSDINPGYPSSWITDYVSAEISATCNGKAVKAVSANDTLSAEQRKILKMADIGTNIVIEVKYLYKSSGTVNVDMKTMSFSVSLVPEVEAEYIGGDEKMTQYLKENTIDKIPEATAKKIELAMVRFTINEEGKIINAQISESSKDEKIDQLLLEVVNEMPKWKPAEDSKGVKVTQEFEFSVGTFIGC